MTNVSKLPSAGSSTATGLQSLGFIPNTLHGKALGGSVRGGKSALAQVPRTVTGGHEVGAPDAGNGRTISRLPAKSCTLKVRGTPHDPLSPPLMTIGCREAQIESQPCIACGQAFRPNERLVLADWIRVLNKPWDEWISKRRALRAGAITDSLMTTLLRLPVGA